LGHGARPAEACGCSAAKLGENKTTSSFTSGVVRNAPLPGPPVGPNPAAVQAYKRKMGLVQRAPLRFGSQITLLSLPTTAEHYFPQRVDQTTIKSSGLAKPSVLF